MSNRIQVSNISELIERRGETVGIYSRTETGTDEFGRPTYTWALKASEKAFIQNVTRASGFGEVATYAGELTIDDRIGFFRSDSAIQDDDQVEWAGGRYDVKAVQAQRVGGATQFKVAVLRRMVE